ncbi:MAG: MBL fold metallo-hydrolase [Dysgonamonadaceae bacterium]|nr:MBL fold metallo-hydrolase [Dysgonamonadaceae bacterium]
MSSNCFIVWDDVALRCIIIDPASEKSLREIEFIEMHGLLVDYIILTHEHTDHSWGVNSLLEKYQTVQVVCSDFCKQSLSKESRAYFQLYYDDPNYDFCVARVDITIEELNWYLNWCGHVISFINTPGHSKGSVCFSIEEMLFGGDTLMPYKPFIKKKNGGSKEEFSDSLRKIQSIFKSNTIVYPGHGDVSKLKDCIYQ